MATAWNPQESDAIPLHHKVYVVLRQQIVDGQYSPDAAMPSEQELARTFEVSRITVRRALERLQREGLVSRARGRGTFARPSMLPAGEQINLRGLFENLLAMGLRTRVKLVEVAYLPASPTIAEILKVKPEAFVQRAIRLRYHRDVPFSHLTTYLPEDIAAHCKEEDLADKPLLLLLERAGVKVTAGEQVISAKLADPIVAPLLEVETGSPLISVKRIVLDQNERPVEYLHSLYRPDIYEYQMKLSRVEGKTITLWQPDTTAAL